MLFRSCLVFALAASAWTVDSPAVAAIRHPGLRGKVAALAPSAQARVLGLLDRRPRLMADAGRLAVSPRGGLCYTNCCAAAHAARPASSALLRSPPVARSPVPIADPPAYSSRPGSLNTLYLDFNGHVVTDTEWNLLIGVDSWDTTPYNTDADATTFSDLEQEAIHLIWQRVAEDYRVFDVNVTTVEPGSFGPRTARALVTRSTDRSGEFCPYDDAGGVAYVDVFGEADFSLFSPAWIYFDNLGSEDQVAEAVSHELGHNLGLSHDGTGALEYYPGHGPVAFDWGPIMGVAYGRELSQWSRGEYVGANNPQDDLSIIASKLSTIADDHGGTLATASTLPVGSGDPRPVASFDGLISSAADSDLFSFTAESGVVTLTIAPRQVVGSLIVPATSGVNLDIHADILDAGGVSVPGLVSDPLDDYTAVINGSLPVAGRYFLRVRGAGNRNAASDGFGTYGSLGTYRVSGSVPAAWPGSLGFASDIRSELEGSDGPRVINVAVRRTPGAVGAVSVQYATSDGTAVAGLDYAGTAGTLSWPDGDTTEQSISITINGDDEVEGDEDFTVTLSAAGGGAVLGTTSDQRVVLQNDDVPPPVPDPVPVEASDDGGRCGIGSLGGIILLCGLLMLRGRQRALPEESRSG